MDPIVYVTIIMLATLYVFSSYVNVYAIELNSTDSITNNFSNNLKARIHSLISEALNSTINSMNTSSILINGSNHTSSQVVISNNKVLSNVSSDTNNTNGNSIIKNQVRIINGVCSSEKIGGNGNDTFSSSGNCNDQLIGGPGDDKFTCGGGNDTIRDYNPKEGDIILDRQNCEIVL